MNDAEPGKGIGVWPWLAIVGALAALTARIIIMLRNPGGDGLQSANFHPWILKAGLPALALSGVAFFAARRAGKPQAALIAGFVAFFNTLMVFISL